MQQITYSDLQNKLFQHNHLDALLALRGLACLMVVVIHCSPPRTSIIYKSFDLSWLTFSHGAVAVWIFFCLSGYLMGKAFYTERYNSDVLGVLNFWRNRALRIFPLYYFAVLILSILVYPHTLKMENWGYLLRVCTFTYHSHITSPSIIYNEALWSLSTEVQFYLLIPFIFNFFQSRVTKPKQVAVMIGFIILLSFICKCISWLGFHNQIHYQMSYAVKYWYAPLINNIDVFIGGFVVNILIKYRNHKLGKSEIFHNGAKPKFLPKSIKYIAVILLILLYLFSSYHLYNQELWDLSSRPSGWRTSTTIFVLQPLTTIIVSFFIFAFDSDKYEDKNEKLSFAAVLKNPLRVLEIFGTLSYGIYIWHMPIIYKIIPIFTSDIPIEAFYARCAATLILSTILATVTYYLVEVPAAKWKIYRRLV